MWEPLPNAAHSVFVLGAGPAGLAAALYLRRAGLSAIVWEKIQSGGQMNTTPDIENYPGFETVGGFELGERMRKQAETAGAVFRTAEITSLDLSGDKPILQAETKSYVCDALIFATGATPRRLGVPGEERLAGRGVSYCATCDGFFFRGKTAAVVGGGDTALEDALYLAGLCEAVHLIHRRGAFRGADTLVRRVRETPNIRLCLNRVVEEITGAAKVESVRLREVGTGAAEDLPLDAVFMAVGIAPESALAAGWLPLDEAGYVLAGEDTATSHPAVFAAGDVRRKPLRQIVTAAADGAVAATMAHRYLSKNP